MNSSGTASAAHASERAGEAGAGAADDLDEEGDGEHGVLVPPPAALWNGSFQRRGRAAPMGRRVGGGLLVYTLDRTWRST